MTVAYYFLGGREAVSMTGFLCVTARVLTGTTNEGNLYRQLCMLSLYMLLLQVCPHQHAELCELGGGGSLRFLSQLLLLVLPTREHDVIGELKSSSQLRCSKETEWHVAGAKVFSKLYPVHLAGKDIIDGTKMDRLRFL